MPKDMVGHLSLIQRTLRVDRIAGKGTGDLLNKEILAQMVKRGKRRQGGLDWLEKEV